MCFDFDRFYSLKCFIYEAVGQRFTTTSKFFIVALIFFAQFYLIILITIISIGRTNLETHPFPYLSCKAAHISFCLLIRFFYPQGQHLILLIFFHIHQCFSLHLLSFFIAEL
jgi:hypothetical protein